MLLCSPSTVPRIQPHRYIYRIPIGMPSKTTQKSVHTAAPLELGVSLGKTYLIAFANLIAKESALFLFIR